MGVSAPNFTFPLGRAVLSDGHGPRHFVRWLAHVHTMGSRITKLTPMQGFCAETAGAITLFMATGLGVPVSTTHTITGAIVGVGAARRVSAVRWNIAKDIVVAWVITMPMSAMIAALFYALGRLVG